MTCTSGAVECMGIAMRPLAMIRSTIPRLPNTSRVRGWIPLPREPGCGPGAASMSLKETPRRASSQARVMSPAGPAPTMSTPAQQHLVMKVWSRCQASDPHVLASAVRLSNGLGAQQKLSSGDVSTWHLTMRLIRPLTQAGGPRSLIYTEMERSRANATVGDSAVVKGMSALTGGLQVSGQAPRDASCAAPPRICRTPLLPRGKELSWRCRAL